MRVPDDDGCPVHALARKDPNAMVRVTEDIGSHSHIITAEKACDMYHLGAFIRRQLSGALDHYGYR
jgi:hypothetical protein